MKRVMNVKQKWFVRIVQSGDRKSLPTTEILMVRVYKKSTKISVFCVHKLRTVLHSHTQLTSAS